MDNYAADLRRVRLLALLAMSKAGGVPTPSQLNNAMGVQPRASNALADGLDAWDRSKLAQMEPKLAAAVSHTLKLLGPYTREVSPQSRLRRDVPASQSLPCRVPAPLGGRRV